MRTHLLLVITDLEIGGTPTVVRELALRLREHLSQVEVVSLKSIGPVGEELIARGVRVTALNAEGVRSLPGVVRGLRSVIVERNIDIVFSFLVHANVVAALATPARARLIESIQTTQLRPRWHWLAQRFAAGWADRIVVPSPSVAAVAKKRSGIDPEQIVVIPNAVEPGGFSGTPIKAEDSEPFPIGFIGRLDPVKRVTDLIEAVAPLKNRVVLHVYGEGAERSRIESAIRSSGATNVVMKGAVRSPQDALAKLGLLVLPSEAEGFGLVLIEAMAAGVPVVATNVPGIRDVVQHGENGLLAPAGRPDALRAAIVRVMEDAVLRRRLIENGFNVVREKFSWDEVLGKYIAVLNGDGR